MTDETSYESMIGTAILGDHTEKERQMRRVDCKMYASQKMFCECGTIHDQKKIQILKDDSGTVKAVCCPACREKAMRMIDSIEKCRALNRWSWNNWDSSELIANMSETQK